MNREKILNLVKWLGLIIALLGVVGCFLGYYWHIKFSEVKETSQRYNQRLSPEKKSFKVAVFGDFAMQEGVVVPIMQHISNSDADIALCTGDMFRHPGVGSAFYLRKLFEENLTKPYFCVPGNHDLSEDGNFSLVYYRLFSGKEQYCFGYGDTLFIMLNSADYGFDESRFRYLESVLEKYRNDYRRCVLVTHIPPVEVVPNGGNFNENMKRKLLKVIEKHQITAIVCGHLHIAETLDFCGIPVYISHTSGQSNRDSRHPSFGYLVLNFNSDGTITHEYVFKEELERSRNYFYGFILEKIYGKYLWFILCVGLFVFGSIMVLAVKVIERKKPSPEKEA